MDNLQPLFLKIAKARKHSQDIINNIHQLASSGDVEAQKKAVGLNAELTRSLLREKHATDDYFRAVGVSLLKKLDPSKTMTRSVYNSLSPRKRLDFVNSGGQVRD